MNNLVCPEEEVIIYKFRPLTNKEEEAQFLQIVLEKKLWCASPDSVNDKKEEFTFKFDYEPSTATFDLLVQVLAKVGSTAIPPSPLSASYVERIAEDARNLAVQVCRNTYGISCFSLTKDDDWLWNEYGGKGNGACIEINIPDSLVGKIYHEVDYVSQKIPHIDTFLESYLFSDKAHETYRNILLTKTKKWENEKEIRFIGKHQNITFTFEGHINKITFGSCVPSYVLEQLESEIADYCQINNIVIAKI